MKEIFSTFLRLGCTSFGGPIAHIGYFHQVCVKQKQWLTEEEFADLVALSQSLPGPASSQVGIALGYKRGGWLGAATSWSAFTLPSAIVLILFAIGLESITPDTLSAVIRGFVLLATVVVANALLNMAQNFCSSTSTAILAVLGLAYSLFVVFPFSHIALIVLALVLGMMLFPREHIAQKRDTNLGADSIDEQDAKHTAHTSPTRTTSLIWIVVLLVGLGLSPLIAATLGSGLPEYVDIFYRTGALVFGGGHVVLPMLEAELVTPGLVSESQFLSGYGAAQLVPGPMFSLSSFVGAIIPGVNPWLGGLVCLLAVYVPSFVLLAATLPFMGSLRSKPLIRNGLTAVNASVVGLLAAAAYEHLFVHSAEHTTDLLITVAGLIGLYKYKLNLWILAPAIVVYGFLTH